MKNTIKSVLLALSLFCVVNVANAVPVVWNLQADNATSGTFTYDIDTDSYSNLFIDVQDFGIFTTADIVSGVTDGNNIALLKADNFFYLNFYYGPYKATHNGDNTGSGSYQVFQYSSGATSNPVNVSIQRAATAVPEPEAYASLMAGLALLGFVARRKAV